LKFGIPTGLNPGGKQVPVVFPLNNIAADASGAGSSDTTLPDVPYNQVTNGTYYVQYHVQVSPPGKQISCGNIIMPANDPKSPAGGMAALPATGSGSISSQSQAFPASGLPILILISLLSLVGLGVRFNRR
jgi:hypothetical protein